MVLSAGCPDAVGLCWHGMSSYTCKDRRYAVQCTVSCKSGIWTPHPCGTAFSCTCRVPLCQIDTALTSPSAQLMHSCLECRTVERRLKTLKLLNMLERRYAGERLKVMQTACHFGMPVCHLAGQTHCPWWIWRAYVGVGCIGHTLKSGALWHRPVEWHPVICRCIKNIGRGRNGANVWGIGLK